MPACTMPACTMPACTNDARPSLSQDARPHAKKARLLPDINAAQ